MGSNKDRSLVSQRSQCDFVRTPGAEERTLPARANARNGGPDPRHPRLNVGRGCRPYGPGLRSIAPGPAAVFGAAYMVPSSTEAETIVSASVPAKIAGRVKLPETARVDIAEDDGAMDDGEMEDMHHGDMRTWS